MNHVLLISINTENEGYQALLQESIRLLESQGVHYSRVSVNHILEAPIALRFAIESYRSKSDVKIRKPDGYLVCGFVPKCETFESVVYEEVLRSLQDMACYYGLALSHHTVFEAQTEDLATLGIDLSAERLVLSCLNLIQIKRQLGLRTTHINTP